MKEKVYLVCDKADDKARSIKGAPNIQVEHMGMCFGRVLNDKGDLLGWHTSSSIGWLRKDLMYHLSKHGPVESFEVIDLIDGPTPDWCNEKSFEEQLRSYNERNEVPK